MRRCVDNICTVKNEKERKRKWQEIKSIMCCCGSGLGEFNDGTDEYWLLKNMGITGVTAGHTSLSEVSPAAADLFVVGRDIVSTEGLPRVVVLTKIMSMKELTEKLEKAFCSGPDITFHIRLI